MLLQSGCGEQVRGLSGKVKHNFFTQAGLTNTFPDRCEGMGGGDRQRHSEINNRLAPILNAQSNNSLLEGKTDSKSVTEH